MTISRSIGLHTGYMGVMCGNGYEGLTDELDNTVKQEAELLGQAFNRDVEIRFNSDRESGGAWLVNSLKGFGSNCQVGLNAGIALEGHYCHKKLDLAIDSVYIETYISASCLKDPSLAKDGTDNDPKCDIYHKTVEDALAWLVANVDTNKI